MKEKHMDKHQMMQHAMRAVMEDMGRAAREGRSRRFTGKPKGVEVTMGDVTLEPRGEAQAEHEMSKGDMDSLSHMDDLGDLEVQR
jgi:hypothetical protein